MYLPTIWSRKNIAPSIDDACRRRTGWARADTIIARVPVRVLVPEVSQSGLHLPLPADEAAHVARVLRLVPGDRLRVFNGRGGEWLARVATSTKASVTVEVLEAAMPGSETRVRYTMAVALLKGDGTDEAIRDAVMMGVATVMPFVAERSEIGAAAALRGHRVERWRRVAVSSAKQCGRAVVPEVGAPVTFAALLAAPAREPRVLLVEPSAGRVTAALADLPAPAAVTLAVGPEGGWTDDEVARAEQAGWILMGLGGRTLRAVSAPLAALAACQAVWRDE